MKRKLLEKDIEKYFRLQCRDVLGIVAEKFTAPGRRSVPDRLCCMPSGRCVFVELKAPGKVPTDNQERDHARRRHLGFDVWVIDTKEGVDKFIRCYAEYLSDLLV